jgi:FkbM family methyltransferase
VNKIYRKLRSLAARSWYAAHPRSIAWQIKHAMGPVHPIITPLGWGEGLKVRIYSRDVIGKSVYQHGVFEPSEARLVTQFLKPGMVFFDLGANFGQYTVLAAERVGVTGRVHSFEPSARMYGELTFNVALNGLHDRCVLNNTALSDKQGTARLSRYEEGAEVYGSLGTQHWANSSIVGYEEVVTTTLDAYVAHHRIEHIDLIKMDIEGAELLALRGGERLLRGANAPAIVLEMVDENAKGFGYSAVDTWEYLESFGYRLFSFNRKSMISRANRPINLPLGQNFLAIRQGFDAWGIDGGS